MLRDIRNTSQTRPGLHPGQSCLGMWACTIWIQGDAPIRHVKTHIPEDTKTHDQRTNSSHFRGKPTLSFNINIDLSSSILLAENYYY